MAITENACIKDGEHHCGDESLNSGADNQHAFLSTGKVDVCIAVRANVLLIICRYKDLPTLLNIVMPPNADRINGAHWSQSAFNEFLEAAGKVCLLLALRHFQLYPFCQSLASPSPPLMDGVYFTE